MRDKRLGVGTPVRIIVYINPAENVIAVVDLGDGRESEETGIDEYGKEIRCKRAGHTMYGNRCPAFIY